MTVKTPVGKYVVASLPREKELAARLVSLGVTEGTTLSIAFFSPFGGPAVINVRGADYALRRSTLEKIGLKQI